MKPSPSLPALLLAALAVASPMAATAQNAEPAAAAPELLPNQKAFLNLPEERRKDFGKHLGESMRLFQQKRIFETLHELNKAEKIFADSAEIANLRGSCYVEIRAFDKALECFQRGLELSPGNASIEFNIAEVMFVERKWQEAHDRFDALLAKIPPENTALSRLVEFKVLLCKLKIGKNDEALILAEKYDFLDDSPFHYYAKAVLAYEEDDKVKAEEWLARAARIFQNPNILAPWQDTLVEYGYIKSFYGEDIES